MDGKYLLFMPVQETALTGRLILLLQKRKKKKEKRKRISRFQPMIPKTSFCEHILL
jgi:hypothetical protein